MKVPKNVDICPGDACLSPWSGYYYMVLSVDRQSEGPRKMVMKVLTIREGDAYVFDDIRDVNMQFFVENDVMLMRGKD